MPDLKEEIKELTTTEKVGLGIIGIGLTGAITSASLSSFIPEEIAVLATVISSIVGVGGGIIFAIGFGTNATELHKMVKDKQKETLVLKSEQVDGSFKKTDKPLHQQASLER